MERLELRDGNKDDDGLLATTDIDLAGSRNLERSELSLELRNVVFEVNESLSDAGLSLIGEVVGAFAVRRILWLTDMAESRPGKRRKYQHPPIV